MNRKKKNDITQKEVNKIYRIIIKILYFELFYELTKFNFFHVVM